MRNISRPGGVLALSLLAASGCKALDLYDSLDDSGTLEDVDGGATPAPPPATPDASCPEGHAEPPPDAGPGRDSTASADAGRADVAVEAAAPVDACTVRATGDVSVKGNLDSSDPVPTAPWDPQAPSLAASAMLSVAVYDSLGGAHTLAIYFQCEGGGQWIYHGLVAASEVSGSGPGSNDEIATGTLIFDTTAELVSNTRTYGGGVSFLGATPDQTIAFDFGSPLSTGGSGIDGLRDYATADSVSDVTQDGRICW